jgi:hypothetical protein
MRFDLLFCRFLSGAGMDEHLLPFIFIVIVIAAIIFIAISAQIKRRKAMLEWAQSRGFTYNRGKIYNLDTQFVSFDCLQQGHSRCAENIITGSLESRSFIAFDYHYTTGSGKNTQHHTMSAVILTSPLILKPLLIRPENFLDKISEFVGFDDIDFESAEFSRKFFVKSPDKRWAYDVINQQMMEYLLAAPVYSICFSMTHIIAWQHKTLSPEGFESAISLINGILDRLPDYLVKQQLELLKND